MSVDPELLTLMPHSVTIEPFASVDSHGKSTYGSGVAYQCQVVKKSRLYRAANGTTAVSSTQVILSSSPGVDPKARLTLTGGLVVPIVQVNSYPDENGNLFDEVLCG
jgi:hypothetical protein